jgi:hypothetical protein
MTGEAVPILLDLVDRKIVRVFDVLFVRKDEGGSVSGFAARDLEPDDVGEFVVFEGASSGLIHEDDVAAAGDLLEPGASAVMIVYENTWAGPFSAAVRRSGGRLIVSERISGQDLIDALEAAEVAS